MTILLKAQSRVLFYSLWKNGKAEPKPPDYALKISLPSFVKFNVSTVHMWSDRSLYTQLYPPTAAKKELWKVLHNISIFGIYRNSLQSQRFRSLFYFPSSSLPSSISFALTLTLPFSHSILYFLCYSLLRLSMLLLLLLPNAKCI